MTAEIFPIMTYLSAVLLLMIIPGVDMAYVIANGIAHGKTGAALAAIGISLGGLIMTCCLPAILKFAVGVSPEALM